MPRRTKGGTEALQVPEVCNRSDLVWLCDAVQVRVMMMGVGGSSAYIFVHSLFPYHFLSSFHLFSFFQTTHNTFSPSHRYRASDVFTRRQE
jgi:hypothetical protein